MNWDLILVAIITALPPTFMALLAWQKADGAVKASADTQAAVQEIHVSINSRMDELIVATAKASRAEGADAQREIQIGEQAKRDSENIGC